MIYQTETRFQVDGVSLMSYRCRFKFLPGIADVMRQI